MEYSLRDKGIVTKDSSVRRGTRYFIRDPMFRIWLRKEKSAAPEESDRCGTEAEKK